MSDTMDDEQRAQQSLPRKLVAGLVSLGFGAVFGVLGMFLLPHALVISVVLIALGGVSAVSGGLLVMKFAGDARFDPAPAPPHESADE